MLNQADVVQEDVDHAAAEVQRLREDCRCHHEGGRPRGDQRPPYHPPAAEPLIEQLCQPERDQHGDADDHHNPDDGALQDAGQPGLGEEVGEVPPPSRAEQEPVGAEVLEGRVEHDVDRPQHDHDDQRDRRAEPGQRSSRPPQPPDGRKPSGTPRRGARNSARPRDVYHLRLTLKIASCAARRPTSRARGDRTPGTQAPFSAVCWIASRTCFGSCVIAVPMVCWIWVFTWVQTGSLEYCTEFGSAFRNDPKVESEVSARIAELVAGSRSYSLSKWIWYLSW